MPSVSWPRSVARPRRTIVYAAWDGEEPGLLGSTEWCETHADELRDKAAVYINSDSNARGFLDVDGSHTLEAFVNEVARDVMDPEKKIDVMARAKANVISNGDADDRQEARTRADLRIRPWARGRTTARSSSTSESRRSTRLRRRGRVRPVSLDLRQLRSLQALRRSELRLWRRRSHRRPGGSFCAWPMPTILPLQFGASTEAIDRYVKEVVKLADDMRAASDEKNRRITDGTFKAYDDPKLTFVVPKPDDAVPYLDFSPLQNASAHVATSAKNYDRAAETPSGFGTGARRARPVRRWTACSCKPSAS